MHSKNYRRPEMFQDKNVVVLGGGLSGIEISLNIIENANKIYYSHRNPMFRDMKLPAKIEQLPPVVRITEDGLVQFTDGRTRKADAILLCTGYQYSFPFLSPECHVIVDLEGKRVNPLYLGVFHLEYPTLAFVGIPKFCLPFPMFAVQAQCVAAVLGGKANLPSREQMEADIVREREKLQFLGQPAKDEHRLGSRRRSYAAALAKLAGCSSVDPVLDDLFDHVLVCICRDATNFRNHEVVIKDSNTYFVKSNL